MDSDCLICFLEIQQDEDEEDLFTCPRCAKKFNLRCIRNWSATCNAIAGKTFNCPACRMELAGLLRPLEEPELIFEMEMDEMQPEDPAAP